MSEIGITMAGSWDVRSPSKTGDSNDGMIFDAVGRALTEWEGVENTCAQLFAILVSANQRQAYLAPAVRAYGSIVSVQSKKTMLREAATAYFARRENKSHFQRQMIDLLEEYVLASNRRNEIAHGCVKNFFVTEKTKGHRTRQAAIGLYLAPSFYNPKKFKDEALTYRYISSDLIYYRQEFTKLAFRISGLCEKLRTPLKRRS